MSASGPAAGRIPADDGSTPPALATVLREHAAGRVGIREVVRVLAGERLLVPLLEVSGDLLEGSDTDPCAGQDRAVAAVSVRAAEGVLGLAFTSTQALAHWDARARPWPTPASRVAAALLAEGGIRLIVDPGGDRSLSITGVALRRLAADAAWPDPWEDPAVREAVVAELAPVLAAGQLRVRLAPADQPDLPRGLAVELAFPAGTALAVAQTRARVVASRLGGNADLRAVFDGTLLVHARVAGVTTT